jgi:hypothetical protein
MSFSKGWKNGVKLDDEEWDSYRQEHEVMECAYPNCKNKRIARDENAVCWNGVHIPKEEFESNLSPMAKLAAVANPTEFMEKHGYYYVTIAIHAECAAEWGMHLIKDAMGDYSIGNKLRGTRQNALQKQSRS